MSNYLDTPDSDNEKSNITSAQLSQEFNNNDSINPSIDTEKDEELEAIIGMSIEMKNEGNIHFSKSEFELAVQKYSEALAYLQKASISKDALIILNRSAAYLALKRYVPALNDANQAIDLDPTNWKGYWRKGLALMSMSKRTFRTAQAIEAFEMCLNCVTLPENKKAEVQNEINKAKARKQQQDAETPPADLSNCVPS